MNYNNWVTMHFYKVSNDETIHSVTRNFKCSHNMMKSMFHCILLTIALCHFNFKVISIFKPNLCSIIAHSYKTAYHSSIMFRVQLQIWLRAILCNPRIMQICKFGIYMNNFCKLLTHFWMAQKVEKVITSCFVGQTIESCFC